MTAVISKMHIFIMHVCELSETMLLQLGKESLVCFIVNMLRLLFRLAPADTRSHRMREYPFTLAFHKSTKHTHTHTPSFWRLILLPHDFAIFSSKWWRRQRYISPTTLSATHIRLTSLREWFYSYAHCTQSGIFLHSIHQVGHLLCVSRSSAAYALHTDDVSTNDYTISSNYFVTSINGFVAIETDSVTSRRRLSVVSYDMLTVSVYTSHCAHFSGMCFMLFNSYCGRQVTTPHIAWR